MGEPKAGIKMINSQYFSIKLQRMLWVSIRIASPNMRERDTIHFKLFWSGGVCGGGGGSVYEYTIVLVHQLD